jgi:hypothetical protein
VRCSLPALLSIENVARPQGAAACPIAKRFKASLSLQFTELKVTAVGACAAHQLLNCDKLPIGDVRNFVETWPDPVVLKYSCTRVNLAAWSIGRSGGLVSINPFDDGDGSFRLSQRRGAS